MDATSFMVGISAPGRFATPSIFRGVQLAMQQGPSNFGLAPGTYTLAQLETAIRNHSLNGHYFIAAGEHLFRAPVYQWDYALNSVDYDSRVYVWGSTNFVIDPSRTTYTVTQSGSVLIGSFNNLVVRPQQFSLVSPVAGTTDENFDFKGGNFFENLCA